MNGILLVFSTCQDGGFKVDQYNIIHTFKEFNIFIERDAKIICLGFPGARIT